jgi:hypothetical protein
MLTNWRNNEVRTYQRALNWFNYKSRLFRVLAGRNSDVNYQGKDDRLHKMFRVQAKTIPLFRKLNVI